MGSLPSKSICNLRYTIYELLAVVSRLVANFGRPFLYAFAGRKMVKVVPLPGWLSA